MKTYEVKIQVDAPAAEVLKLMATPQFAEKHAEMDTAVGASSRLEHRDDHKVVLMTEREELEWGPGGKYHTKREKQFITQEWDLKAMTCRWQCRIPAKKFVHVKGETWVEPDGERCLLRERGSADIKLPFVGNNIAALVADDLVQSFPKLKPLIETHLCPAP